MGFEKLRLARAVALLLAGCSANATSPKKDPIYMYGESDIRKWNDLLILESGSFYHIDLVKRRATKLTVSGVEHIQQLEMAGPEHPVVFGRASDNTGMLFSGPPPWSRVTLPPAVRKAPGKYFMVADDSHFWFISESQVQHVDNRGRIQSHPWKLPMEWLLDMNGPPDCGRKIGDELYLGFNWGEFGGGLVAFNIQTGKIRLVHNRHPITELAGDKDGQLFVLEEINHLGHQAGRVEILEGTSWKTLSSVDSYDSGGCKNVNWNLPTATISDITLPHDGAIHILAEYLGILRWNGSGWTRLTTWWPRKEWRGQLYLQGGQALHMLSKDRAVVAFGQVLYTWDLASDTVWTIAFE